jgi:hypothetical protein
MVLVFLLSEVELEEGNTRERRMRGIREHTTQANDRTNCHTPSGPKRSDNRPVKSRVTSRTDKQPRRVIPNRQYLLLRFVAEWAALVRNQPSRCALWISKGIELVVFAMLLIGNNVAGGRRASAAGANSVDTL